MNSIKIHGNARQQRRESQYQITKYKQHYKQSVYNTVSRLERRFGYVFQNPENELCQTLKNQRQEFQDYAVKYCRGYNYCKKQTRFDKMRIKEETGLKLEELPIKKVYQRIDRILVKELKRYGLLALLKNK